MANKRQLKKFINTNCLDLVFVTFLANCTAAECDEEKYSNLINEIGELRTQALSAVSVAFDKTPSCFENKKEYNKARKAYYKQAFKKFNEEYIQRLQAIVDQVNALQAATK